MNLQRGPAQGRRDARWKFMRSLPKESHSRWVPKPAWLPPHPRRGGTCGAVPAQDDRGLEAVVA
jgi:hypothetical protein